mgnify:CR=1 FL=1
MPNILYTKGLTFTPTEINMSIRPGWFWHLEEEPHSLERLFTTYLGSVGSNACMHLNLPPNKDGRIDERDVKRLKEFGALLQEEFGTELDVKIREEESPKTQKVYTISLKQPTDQIRYVSLREDLTKGQRVEAFGLRRSPAAAISIRCIRALSSEPQNLPAAESLRRAEPADQRHGRPHLSDSGTDHCGEG